MSSEAGSVPAAAAPMRPEVVLDVEHRAGAVVLVLANTGTSTAFCPRVDFDRSVVGVDGVDLSELPLWRALPMLRPGRQVEILLDVQQAHPSEDSRFAATVTYVDGDDREFSRTYAHDLALYRDAPILLG